MTIHNFNSGPSILPGSVLEEAAGAIHSFNGSGLSILEIGHRTHHFVEVMEEARNTVRKLMDLPDTHEVLLLIV
jgi:phosphoserine aminotransferase